MFQAGRSPPDGLGLTNLVLAAFNLLPAFPLDGGRVLHSIIWAVTLNAVVATWWVSTIGEGFGWFFIIRGIVLVFAGDFVNGIWFALMGWIIQRSAAAYRHAPTARALQALTVADVITRSFDPIPPQTDLDDAPLTTLRDAPEYADLLRRVRDWTLRTEGNFWYHAPRLFALISGGIDDRVMEVLGV